MLKPLIVEIKFYSTLREVIGREALRLRLKRGATVQEVLGRLISRYGKKLKEKLSQRGNWVIMLNDRNIKFMNDLETSLKDGDCIAILSPLSGG